MAIQRLNPVYEPTFAKGTTRQSALGITLTSNSGYTCSLSALRRFGNVITGTLYITASTTIAANTQINPFSSNMIAFSITSLHYNGITSTVGNCWIRTTRELTAGTAFDSSIIGIIV